VGHEICHNVGCDHDPDHANARPYIYGTGHFIESNDAEEQEEEEGEDVDDEQVGYRTIMSYKKKGYRTRINFYSNPDVVLDSGAPTGTDLSNNARVLIRNRFRLAAQGDESSPTCQPREEESLEVDSDENEAEDKSSSSIEYDVEEDAMVESSSDEEGPEDASYIIYQEDGHEV
jgi:hypothetical protein